MTMLSIRSYVVMMLLAAMGGCAAADPAEQGAEIDGAAAALRYRSPEVPAALAVPEGNRLAFLFDATGVQIYACQANATGYGWVFVAPEAELFKSSGRLAGTHYAGPTWEALDGSTVVAARVAGYVDDPTAIPWLLLNAVSHTGEGKMAKVSFIQRLETAGGLAPTTGCDADHVGAQAAIDYTATYYFYEPVLACDH